MNKSTLLFTLLCLAFYVCFLNHATADEDNDSNTGLLQLGEPAGVNGAMLNGKWTSTNVRGIVVIAAYTGSNCTTESGNGPYALESGMGMPMPSTIGVSSATPLKIGPMWLYSAIRDSLSISQMNQTRQHQVTVGKIKSIVAGVPLGGIVIMDSQPALKTVCTANCKNAAVSPPTISSQIRLICDDGNGTSCVANTNWCMNVTCTSHVSATCTAENQNWYF